MFAKQILHHMYLLLSPYTAATPSLSYKIINLVYSASTTTTATSKRGNNFDALLFIMCWNSFLHAKNTDLNETLTTTIHIDNVRCVYNTIVLSFLLIYQIQLSDISKPMEFTMVRRCFTSAISLVCLVFACLTNVYLFFDHQHEHTHTYGKSSVLCAICENSIYEN